MLQRAGEMVRILAFLAWGERCGTRLLRMPTLPDVLTSEAHKGRVVEDCCALIDAEVKDKGGISGLAIKAGYGAIKGVKPGFVKNVVSDWLLEFATALDPVYQEAKASG